MEKLPIDPGSLPEPFKSLLQNLDPSMIKQMLSMYDPATLSVMLSSMMSLLKDSFSQEQASALKEMLDSILHSMTQNK